MIFQLDIPDILLQILIIPEHYPTHLATIS